MKRTFWIAVAAISLATPAFAQDPTEAAQGETRDKMEAAAQVAEEAAPAPAPAPAPPTGEWKANLGANLLLNTGNSESTNFGGSGLASYKWDRNKLETTAIGAYGRAKDNTAVPPSSTTNTKNWKIVERYDRYIWDPLSLFAFGHLGQDQPSGIDWRYGGSGGVSHEVVRTDPHFFKYEVGFDYTRELRLPPPDANLYSARLFLGYKFKLSDWATFGEDLENLFDLVHGKDYRLNSLTALTMKLTTKVGFQFGFQARFDNVPVPGKKKLDTSTVAGLVVNIL